MKKIAVFTEGQTEQLFVLAAIKFLADQRSLHIKRQKLLGGRKFPTMYMNVGTEEGDAEDCELYFLLVDCASDERVVTAINENYQKLVDEGFEVILGIRDLRPDLSIDQLGKLLIGIDKSLPKGQVKPGVVVAVMEIEAWFLAEHSHFSRLDSALSTQAIKDRLNIDLPCNSEVFEDPAQTLAEIYNLAGHVYDKSEAVVRRTIDALDFTEFRSGAVFERSKSARLLFMHLESSMRLPE